jgi:hypothetical protein
MDNNNSSCTGLMSTAERELGAFISAVTELYGPEQAQISAGDWLDELESMDGRREFASRELRLITIAAAARLANRLIAVGQHLNPIPDSMINQRQCEVPSSPDHVR